MKESKNLNKQNTKERKKGRPTKRSKQKKEHIQKQNIMTK